MSWKFLPEDKKQSGEDRRIPAGPQPHLPGRLHSAPDNVQGIGDRLPDHSGQSPAQELLRPARVLPGVGPLAEEVLEALEGVEAGPGVDDHAQHGGGDADVQGHQALLRDDVQKDVTEVSVLSDLGHRHHGPGSVKRVGQELPGQSGHRS